MRNYKLSDYTPISIFTSKAFVEIYLDSIYLFNPETLLNNKDLPKAYKAYPIISQRMSDMLFSSRIRGMFADKYYFFCNDRDSILEFYNVLNNSNFVFSLDDNKEYIVHAFPTKNSFYLISNKKIYSFDNRYLLTASFRRDGSSRFGSVNRYGNFPSIAVGWNVSNLASQIVALPASEGKNQFRRADRTQKVGIERDG